MNEIKTNWSKETPPYGAFDDYVNIESIDRKERILIRLDKFEYLISKLFENWRKQKSKYIQILKEWNECSGFNDIDEKPSIIMDNRDTINALKLIEGVDEMKFATLTKKDLDILIDFLVRNEKDKLKIWKE
ncbi:hypothetical protein [Flammeovirga sp. EKP202]|uniref:hypothetical protein n=1 Tax=Flammeovirga sp. EKP202 TaxID=2770592 RepID=UPI00165F1E0A|nr:hypothetical protein [Flammeovirga sp. EKP202]MBD0404913.1 hypothetical protein [Flammeovirga sp. EKP202]